jgi:hypothetical protein
LQHTKSSFYVFSRYFLHFCKVSLCLAGGSCNCLDRCWPWRIDPIGLNSTPMV